MNPTTPQNRRSHLVRYASREIVRATVRVDFPSSELVQIEEFWKPERQRIATAIATRLTARPAEYHQDTRMGTRYFDSETRRQRPRERAFEHGHWNWNNKIEFVNDGTLILVSVECEGQVQGLMAIARQQSRSRYAEIDDSPDQPLLYVEYVEAAPWNLALDELQLPIFSGVGTVLIGEAIRLSFQSGCEGRIGLHSLPQAEQFYRNRCEMSLVEWDESYYGLSYFELSKRVAANWLELRGLNDD